MFGFDPRLEAMGVRAEKEGCPNFERSSKFIRSAYADRAALKTRHWRVFFTLRALAGSNPSSCALLDCAQKKKKPHCWGLYHLMAEEEGFEPS